MSMKRSYLSQVHYKKWWGDGGRETHIHINLLTSSFSFRKTVHSLRTGANKNGTKNNVYIVPVGKL